MILQFLKIFPYRVPRFRGAYFFSMSAISKYILKLKAFESRARDLSSHEVIVGWAKDAKEQPRAKPKEAAKAANVGKDGRKVKKGEFISNFDENFVGPGQQAASLAVIAKTLCYGREGGTTKGGHEYGRIPARNFVKVLEEKHRKVIDRIVEKALVDDGSTAAKIDMETIADAARGQLQRAMRNSNEYAKNAPITIHGGWMADPKTKKPFYVEPKGSERPLWNTGTLINSVRSEVKAK